MNGRQDFDELSRKEFRAESSVRRSETVGELSGKSATELESEIRMIRAEMDDTLRELERKFSPGELLDRALHQLPGGPKEFAVNLGSALRDNPLPATLTGIGIAWLAATSGRPRYRAGIHRTGPMRKKIRETTKAVAEKFHRAGENIQSGISQAREGMHETGEKAGAARKRAGRIGQSVQERGRQIREGVVDMGHEHPVLLAGIGLAVGALIGAALPPTSRERRLMGEARGIKEEEQMESAEAAFQTTTEAVQEETERRLH